MKTLIELYDERPIENVLASEVFRPERTVFLCGHETASGAVLKNKIQAYFRHCGLETEVIFRETDLYSTDRVAETLEKVSSEYPDCAADITGGTDAALFACGAVCMEKGLPAFTYSRKKNRFYGIHRAEFAEGLICQVQHTVEDCFLMAGGALRQGRVDNAVLSGYMDRFEQFFRLYLKYRNEWVSAVNYFQTVSQTPKGQEIRLTVEAGRTVTGAHGKKLEAPVDLLYALQKIHFLKNVKVSQGKVRFVFCDAQVRTWLRDIGSVLELYIYRVCVRTGLFNDVVTSAVVDWEGEGKQDDVTNEIDVMAMRGILPVFISCKTCAVNTEALNELAILRDRFGGQGAKAVIVTTKRCQNITRRRASELGISVVDLDELKTGSFEKSFAKLLK